MNFGIREHLVTIFRHWVMVLIVLMTALFVAGAVAFLSSKAYVASSRVLILGQSQVERATQARLNDGSPTSSPQEQVLTQVAIAKSPLLAERLALELGPQRVLDEMRWRWDWVRELPGKLKDRIILTMVKWEPTEQLIRMVGIKIPGTDGDGGPPVGPAMEKLLKAMVAEAVTKTDMFVIGYQAPSPEFSAEVVNALTRIYIEHVVSLRSPTGTAEITQKEAARLRSDLNEAERALRAFAEEQNIYSIDRQKGLLLDRLARTQEELVNAERDVLEAEQKVEAIRGRIANLPNDGSISTTLRPNPVVDRLRDRLSQLQTDIERFVPGSAAEARVQSEIRSIESQLSRVSSEVKGAETKSSENSIYQQLQTSLTLQQVEAQALKVRRDFITRQLVTAEEELRRIDSQEMEYLGLKRNVETKEQAYRFAVQKREELAITSQLSEASLAPVVQVEPATPPLRPSSPRRKFLLIIGTIVGLTFGIALAYVLEFSRKTMSTPREAELALGLRVLAVIDRLGLFTRRSEKNLVEYRRFGTWLKTRMGAEGTVALGFASAHKNPAQTDVIDQTAAALHQQGSNVLTVRVKPVSGGNKRIEIPAPPEGVEAELGVQTASIACEAWNIPREFRSLLDQTEAYYDFILVDLPTVADVPEQMRLVGSVDGIILVLEADRTRVAIADEAKTQYEDAGANIVGVVLNNRRHNRSSWAFSWMADTKRRSRERNATA